MAVSFVGDDERTFVYDTPTESFLIGSQQVDTSAAALMTLGRDTID